jgi:hypothetical protein
MKRRILVSAVLSVLLLAAMARYATTSALMILQAAAGGT